MPSAPSIPPPPVGSVIADGSLELVDILGYGGYGIVYRAVDTATRRQQYAVKCLTHAQASRQRNLHLREIQLHRLASAHPAVVSLSHVIDDARFTYIVLDYYADGDLFTQILHKKRYLGNEALIRDVYLQLLDAVQHCHDLGVYHRDLKPENVLCKRNGDSIAITDFGLATTDEMSTEFRTGSIYHMSPECHGPEKQHPSLGIASKGGYNPAANDVWSLGIMLLNLTTGRNPWKSATSSDPTFWAYLHDRANFLPTVLPVSRELNALLVRILDPVWSTRITLPELRREVVKLRSIYADDVVFDDAMARCAWEVALEPDSPEESMAEAVAAPPVPAAAEAPSKPVLNVQVEHSLSTWSDDTPLEADAPMSFASPTDIEADSFLELHDRYILRAEQEPSPVVAAASTWSARSSAPVGTWRHRSSNPSPVSATMPTWLRAASGGSAQSEASVDSVPSLPPTPKVPETKFARMDYLSVLAINTDVEQNEAGPDSAIYSASSFMRTAVESADDECSMAPAPAPWTSHFFPSEPVVAKVATPVTAHIPAGIMDEVLKTPLDDEPISPLCFSYMARGDSFTSLGHDADIEDFLARPAVPRSAPAHTSTFQPFGAGRSFFAPRSSSASSSSSVSVGGCAGTVPRTPAGGRTRPLRTRRASGRFNPLKLALRSLSPGRARAAADASSSSASRTPSPKPSVEPSLTVTRAARPRPVPTRKSTGKLGWLGGRLFGTAS